VTEIDASLTDVAQATSSHTTALACQRQPRAAALPQAPTLSEGVAGFVVLPALKLLPGRRKFGDKLYF
jgi:hypothetical protein